MNRITKTLATLGLIGTLAGCTSNHVKPVVQVAEPVISQPVQAEDCSRFKPALAGDELKLYEKRLDKKMERLAHHVLSYGEINADNDNSSARVTLNTFWGDIEMYINTDDVKSEFRNDRYLRPARKVLRTPERDSYDDIRINMQGRGDDNLYYMFSSGGAGYSGILSLLNDGKSKCRKKREVFVDEMTDSEARYYEETLDYILGTFADNKVAKR